MGLNDIEQEGVMVDFYGNVVDVSGMSMDPNNGNTDDEDCTATFNTHDDINDTKCSNNWFYICIDEWQVMCKNVSNNHIIYGVLYRLKTKIENFIEKKFSILVF